MEFLSTQPTLLHRLLHRRRDLFDLSLTMPPNYHLESFWEDRFQHESQFEWLGDGAETILPHIRASLRTGAPHSHPLRILHIGAGTSSLSRIILEKSKEEFINESRELFVVNTDFSETAVRRGNTASADDERETWVKVDALKWNEVRALVNREGSEYSDLRFTIVVDKSTSDAIACGEDACFTLYGGDALHSDIETYLKESRMDAINLPPVYVLALHLASIVRPGGAWIVLSYAAGRFPFLHKTDGEVSDPLGVARFWMLEQYESVDAPSGQLNPSVFAPPVKHYVYVIRRTQVEARS